MMYGDCKRVVWAVWSCAHSLSKRRRAHTLDMAHRTRCEADSFVPLVDDAKSWDGPLALAGGAHETAVGARRSTTMIATAKSSKGSNSSSKQQQAPCMWLVI